MQTRLSINCKGQLISLEQPLVMGILNLSPDSFYDGNKVTSVDLALKKVEQFVKEGATIIDVGGQSTKPKAQIISSDEEIKRVIPVIEKIASEFPLAIISIDTFKSKVANEAMQAGASIINDVSAYSMDENMLQLITKLNVPYILMHIQGTPATMQINPQYTNVVTEVFTFIQHKIFELRQLGVKDIIVDVGFGFGKTVTHNYCLLANLKSFEQLSCALLVGLSRKSMIGKALQTTAQESLSGTTALHMAALMNGAKILRVHDVKEAIETVKLFNEIEKNKHA
jgi:dihydropteroate synthase